MIVVKPWQLKAPNVILVTLLGMVLGSRFSKTPPDEQARAHEFLERMKIPTEPLIKTGEERESPFHIVGIALILFGSIMLAVTALVLFTIPSRSAFVIAKVLVHTVFVAVTVMAGTVITWGGTVLLFGQAPAGPLFAATGAWLAFGFLFIATMTLLSVLLGSSAGAAGIGLGAYALVSIATIWKPLGTGSPAALVGGPATLAAGKAFAAGWPIATSLLLAVAIVALAVLLFNRKEL